MSDTAKLLSRRLGLLLGPSGWLTSPDVLAAHGRDWLDRYGEPPLGVARPSNVDDVARTVGFCAEHGFAVVPQGGNTNLTGAAVVSPGRPGIILNLSRMNRILEIDGDEFTATVEAGVVLSRLHEALAEEDLAFPMHLGAEGSAQIGGLVGTNAGGSQAARFGMMQEQILGLEVVLADGSVWDGARALLKDNAGYQLRRLFCGSEGTLGIVTKAVLRLVPAPTSHCTALLAVADFGMANALSAHLRRFAGDFLAVTEFFTQLGVEMVCRHVEGMSPPLETAGPVYVMVELATTSRLVDLPAVLDAALGEAFELSIVLDGAIAASEAQRARFWRLREEMPEGQRREGEQIKHDVSVPVGRLPAFIADAGAAVDTVLPAIRLNPFGHLGDGNVHFNLSPPAGQSGFLGREAAISEAVYSVVLTHEGSIAAEHGLGQAKRSIADRFRQPEERALMRAIKKALDPHAILNPGKLV